MSETSLIETMEREFEEEASVYEGAFEDELLNLRGRHNQEQCEKIRESSDNSPPNAIAPFV